VGDTPLVTYLPTNGQHLFLTEQLTKVKLDSTSLEVHPQLSHSRQLVDGALVDMICSRRGTCPGNAHYHVTRAGFTLSALVRS